MKKRIAKLTLADESVCIDLTDSTTQFIHPPSNESKNFSNRYDAVLVSGLISPDYIEYMKNPWIEPAATASKN